MKIDHAFSEKHHISGMYNSTDRPYIKSPGPSRLLPVGNTTAIANYNLQDVTTNIVRLNYDWTISPTLLNHVGVGFSRFRNPNFSLGYNQGWEQPNGGKLGLTGTQYDLFPTIQFDTQGYTRFGDDIASDNYFNTITLLDNLTWIKGKHTIKIGVGDSRPIAITTGTLEAAVETSSSALWKPDYPVWLTPAIPSPAFFWAPWTTEARTSALRCRVAGTSISACYVDDTFKVTHEAYAGSRPTVRDSDTDFGSAGPHFVHESERAQSRRRKPAGRGGVRQ